MTKPFVAILMGSDSDLETMQTTVETLDKFQIAREVRVLSAHRTPDATHAYVKDADARGCAVFIAAAGMAAHLAGTVAALQKLGGRLTAGAADSFFAYLEFPNLPFTIELEKVK